MPGQKWLVDSAGTDPGLEKDALACERRLALLARLGLDRLYVWLRVRWLELGRPISGDPSDANAPQWRRLLRRITKFAERRVSLALRSIPAYQQWRIRHHREVGCRRLARSIRRTITDCTPNGRIVLPPCAAPSVSIIVPVHNQWEHTALCLQSIAVNSGDVPYEVILADDASTDATRNAASAVANLSVVRNDAALGFLRNCNAAARTARGKYVLFLNNDTVVRPGWLQALVDVAENDGRVGLVGSKLIFPDGSLQEAGGIVWRDGSGWNFGRGDLFDRSEYAYVRDVDYVSGASILVPRSLWEEIGGFDERYAPAYYEDTDLAFEMRRRGYRVVYQPASEVIHFEGVSHGKDPQSGIKQHQVTNRQRFVEKWRLVLEDEHYPGGTPLFLACRRRRGKKQVLVLDWQIPTPDRDSGSVRMANLLKILAASDCDATMFPLIGVPIEPSLAKMRQEGVFVVCETERPTLEQFLKQYGCHFDLVIISRVVVGEAGINAVRRHCPSALVVFDTVDLHFLREQRHAAIDGGRTACMSACITKRNELRIMRQADLTLVVSPVEQELLRREAPDVDVRILSNIHSVHDRGEPFSVRKNLLFLGSFLHDPNVDAVLWFVREMLPNVRRRLPGVELIVIGSEPPKELFQAEGVRVLGYVEDIGPYLRSCRLSVVPLRYGAGVKGKINTSMSHGLPVVSTSIGCEGMFLHDQTDVLMADEPQEFVDAVCRLYADEAIWSRLVAGGIENIARCFSFDVAAATVRQILALADQKRRPAPASSGVCAAEQ